MEALALGSTGVEDRSAAVSIVKGFPSVLVEILVFDCVEDDSVVSKMVSNGFPS